LLDLQGALVTIDAMGCQTEIAQKIVDAGADYVLTVKENQPHLYQDILKSLTDACEVDYRGIRYEVYQTEEKGHGRQEKRVYTVLYQVDGIRDRQKWANLTVVGMCYSERTVAGQTSDELRLFIGSRDTSAEVYGEALRGHWGIENNLHWQLDVSFREDDNRVQNRRGGQNLAFVRKIALCLLQRHKAKKSIANKRLAAAYDTNFLEEVLQQGENLGNL